MKKKVDCRSSVEKIEASEKQKVVDSTQPQQHTADKGRRKQREKESRKEKQKINKRRQIKLHEKIFYRNKSYRMSNTTKTVMVVTEMVAEMKPGNRDEEDNAEEGRSLR